MLPISFKNEVLKMTSYYDYLYIFTSSLWGFQLVPGNFNHFPTTTSTQPIKNQYWNRQVKQGYDFVLPKGVLY